MHVSQISSWLAEKARSLRGLDFQVQIPHEGNDSLLTTHKHLQMYKVDMTTRVKLQTSYMDCIVVNIYLLQMKEF